MFDTSRQYLTKQLEEEKSSRVIINADGNLRPPRGETHPQTHVIEAALSGDQRQGTMWFAHPGNDSSLPAAKGG